MIRLGVNIDHVATIRQARRGREPDPVWAAVLAQLGGADGITIHLREDRRHIQDDDVLRLRQAVPGRLNLEMAASPEIVAIACRAKPDYATLVPERRAELTTEGGLDVITHVDAVRQAISSLLQAGIGISLFIDADPKQIAASQQLGAQAVEFHTGRYADAPSSAVVSEELRRLHDCAVLAHQAGLHVHMGHGLNYLNVQAVAGLPHVEELNIGHSIIARAVMVGMEKAVREMKDLIRSATS
jgi:pyridoxine 5-phosphate synthase